MASGDDGSDIYSNREAIFFNDLIKSREPLQEDATWSDESDFSDSSFDDEEEEEQKEEEQGEEGYLVPNRQPVQDANGQDCHLQARPPYPTPRKPKPEEPHYLDPIQVKPPPPPPTTSFPSKFPYIVTKGMTKNIKPSLIKVSKDSQPLPQRPRIPHRPAFLESNNNRTSASENGRGSPIGVSFLHRLQQENKLASPPKIPKPKKPAWTVPEKNEHEYEYVDNPSALCGGPETSASALQDFDDHEWNNQLGIGTSSLKKQPPVLTKHQKGTDSHLAPGSLQHVSHNRQPNVCHPLLANGSSFSCKTSLSENPPNESAPPQPYVTLDDKTSLELTSLYQKLMEKPYFHLISRPKAKDLIMSGEDGMFLIRPSTKSGDPLTLVLNLDNHPYNINIRQRPDSLFALGKEKIQEKTFSSIDELVNTYSREAIKLENGKMAFLKNTPLKKGNSYVKHYPTGLAKKY